MSQSPLPHPDGPPQTRITEVVAMAHVRDVDRSAAFYALLGFSCESRFSSDRGLTNWCALRSHNARLFLARATAPVRPEVQAVLLYMYAPDVRALRAHLVARGVPDAGPIFWEEGGSGVPPPQLQPAAFEVVSRFYMPEGELRVHDPDGYVILVGQLG